MGATIDLAKKLISRPSVTPADGGCQQLIADHLTKVGFKAEPLRCADVDNLWITHGTGSPCFIYVGHTDVVPTGPLENWTSDPFTPEIRDGHLYGRGAADMKGSIACMVTALERFVGNHPDHKGTVGMLITSDEEGPAVNGTRRVVEYLQANNIRIDWCLVGEPCSETSIGDVIKNGRRGSLGATLRVYGIQGHVAYPQHARNPVHLVSPALTELCNRTWDQGNEFYPPTTFQISNIHGGTGADNVIPGHIDIMFNFRFSTELTHDQLRKEVESLLDRHQLDYDIDWNLSGDPFLTPGGKLLDTVQNAVTEITGRTPKISTGGGTSDGRFIAPTGAEVIELGPVNATIHKVNECVNVEDLDTLSAINERILEKLMVG
jgi:succinyl-diaminopimelate desuccinylase